MARQRRARGEGSLFFSKSKRLWIGRPIIGHGPDGKPVHGREVSGTDRLVVLERMRQAIRTAGEEAAAPGRLTVGEHLTRWLEDVCRSQVRPVTWLRYRDMLDRHLLPRLGSILLVELRPRHVQQCYADIAAAGAGNSLNIAAAILNAALALAVVEEAIPHSPLPRSRRPRRPPPEVQPFTATEVQALLAAASKQRRGCVVHLAFGTGARISEILALEWPHLDLAAGTVRFQQTVTHSPGATIGPPKSRQGYRTLDLPAFALEAVRHLRQRSPRQPASQLLFPNRTGDVTTRLGYRHTWVRIVAAAGVPFRKFHTIRTTHASELLRAGISVAEVARRLGDSPEIVMRYYARYLPSDQDRITGHLDDLYGR